MRIAILVAVAITLNGCALFIPSNIKRQQSVIRVDIETARIESNELRGEAKSLYESGKFRESALKALESQDKIKRSYDRVLPHIIFIDDYMRRKK
jgi:hypothetical protein